MFWVPPFGQLIDSHTESFNRAVKNRIQHEGLGRRINPRFRELIETQVDQLDEEIKRVERKPEGGHFQRTAALEGTPQAAPVRHVPSSHVHERPGPSHIVSHQRPIRELYANISRQNSASDAHLHQLLHQLRVLRSQHVLSPMRVTYMPSLERQQPPVFVHSNYLKNTYQPSKDETASSKSSSRAPGAVAFATCMATSSMPSQKV